MPDPHFPFERHVDLEKNKRKGKSIRYAHTISIYSCDQQLYYVSSVTPPYINSICSFPIVRTEGRCIKMPLCSLVSKFLRQGLHTVLCDTCKILYIRTKLDWRTRFQNFILNSQNEFVSFIFENILKNVFLSKSDFISKTTIFMEMETRVLTSDGFTLVHFQRHL